MLILHLTPFLNSFISSGCKGVPLDFKDRKSYLKVVSFVFLLSKLYPFIILGFCLDFIFFFLFFFGLGIFLSP